MNTVQKEFYYCETCPIKYVTRFILHPYADKGILIERQEYAAAAPNLIQWLSTKED